MHEIQAKTGLTDISTNDTQIMATSVAS